jgi:hypothetical protein
MSHNRTGALIVLVAGFFLCAILVTHGAEARELKISHQFTEADARNALAVEFAKRVEKQTKVLDACMTSAESFVSYRLYEQLEDFNTPENYSVWYMGEPLVMSTKTWTSLTPGLDPLGLSACGANPLDSRPPHGSLSFSPAPWVVTQSRACASTFPGDNAERKPCRGRTHKPWR